MQLIDQPQHLDGDQRGHGHHGHHAEGVCDDVSAHGHAGALGKGQQEGCGHGTGGHAARVKGDGREDLGHEKGQPQGDGIAGDEHPQDVQPGEHPQHGQAHGHRHAHGQRRAHGLFRDGAVGQLLHLLIQHIDRGLGPDDEVADEHPDGDDDPMIGQRRHLLAQIVAGGHEAHVGPGEKQHQAHIGIDQAHPDPPQLAAGHFQADRLKNAEKQDDGRQGKGDLPDIGGEALVKQLPQLHGVRHIGNGGRRIGAAVGIVDHAQDEHRQNGTHRAQGHQAEGVVGGVAVVSDGGDAHAQRHDKGYRHGAGGDAAGVKGHRQKALGHKQGKAEHQYVAAHQQVGQGDAQQHTQQGHHQKQAHAAGHREDQHIVGYGGHLLGQHLQVRLGNGDDEAQNKAQGRHHPDFFAAGHGGAHLFPHGRHTDLRAQGEEHGPHHDEGRAHQKAQQNAGRYGRHGEAQHHHDADDGQDRPEGLRQLFFQFYQGGMQNASPSFLSSLFIFILL